MNVVSAKFGPVPANDLADKLRALADAVDRGEVTDLVAAYQGSDKYAFMYSASLRDGIMLSTMLQANCVQRMRA